MIHIFLRHAICSLMIMVACSFVQAKETCSKVNWVEVVKHRLSTQIMFDFSSPVECKRVLVPEKHQLRLFFPQVDYHSCSSDSIINKLNVLKEIGLAQKISIIEETGGQQGVVIALDLQPKNAASDEAQQFLIKTCSIENPHRFILNIFSKDDLELFRQQDHLLQTASNDAVQNDYTSTYAAKKKDPTQLRVMIDAGHGGSELGTQAPCGTQEKNLTLDLARRVQQLLKKQHVNVVMTRNADTTVGLSERCSLAAQMKADLFVSIHVNSSGIYPSSPHEGIETFYLDGKKELGGKNVGFVFVNMPTDYKLAYGITREMNDMLNQSHQLASTIHKNLLGTIKVNGYSDVVDRGIKKNRLRVLMMNQIPSTLIEVGFLTSLKERSRLKNKKYRDLIAQGIAKGIMNYIKA